MREVVAVDGSLSTHFHFEQPSFAALHRESDTRNSVWRAARIRALAEAEDDLIEPRRLFDLYSDHERRDDGCSVCLHAGKMRVLGTIVVDARTRTVLAGVGNPCEANPVAEVQLTETGPQVR